MQAIKEHLDFFTDTRNLVWWIILIYY